MSRTEKFIQDYTMICSNELSSIEDGFGKKIISYHEWITPYQARKAVEIAREEMIEKAYKWLQGHYRVINGEIEDYILSFKQAMKDE